MTLKTAGWPAQRHFDHSCCSSIIFCSRRISAAPGWPALLLEDTQNSRTILSLLDDLNCSRMTCTTPGWHSRLQDDHIPLGWPELVQDDLHYSWMTLKALLNVPVSSFVWTFCWFLSVLFTLHANIPICIDAKICNKLSFFCTDAKLFLQQFEKKWCTL